jgi:hypothetical protein
MGPAKTCHPSARGAILLFALALAACSDDEPPRSAGDAAADADAAISADVPADSTDVPPVPAALGAPCEEDRACQSGICADGTCCASACVGPCRRCDNPGQLGQCQLLAQGAPCGGKLCKDLVTFQPQSSCDGAGRCIESPPISCAPTRCLDDACVVACTRNDECDPPATCHSGTCRKGGPPAAVCSSAQECATGFCQQGVCCDRPCTGVCESCLLPASRGRCSPIPGCPADAGSD